MDSVRDSNSAKRGVNDSGNKQQGCQFYLERQFRTVPYHRRVPPSIIHARHGGLKGSFSSSSSSSSSSSVYWLNKFKTNEKSSKIGVAAVAAVARDWRHHLSFFLSFFDPFFLLIQLAAEAHSKVNKKLNRSVAPTCVNTHVRGGSTAATAAAAVIL